MHLATRSLLPGAAMFLAGAVLAQPPAGYVSDFEGLMAAAAGVNMWDPGMPAGTPGQDNYYWPPGTTSVPHLAYTYAGNSLSVPPNPTGGNIFIAGNGPAGGAFARAQRDISYGCNTGTWTFGTDILIQFNGTLPTAQNVGSLSSQPGGTTQFIMLARWTDPMTALNWNADFVAGTTMVVPDPAFQNLNVNQWYRWETDIDIGTGQILEIRIIDLMGGTTATHQPAGWSVPTTSPPSAFRFFAGGGVAGNTIAWDNISVTPGKVNLIPGCTNPANSLTVGGIPRLGDTVIFNLDAPAMTVTPGASFGVLALGFAPGVGLPCGGALTIPGLTVTGNVLIGVPTAALLISAGPWTGPGTPVPIAFPMPPNLSQFCQFIGTPLYAQGGLLDPGGSSAVLTGAAELILGG